MTILMKGVSAVLHPLLMATYMSALIAFRIPELLGVTNPVVIPRLVLMIFVMTAVLPGIAVYVLSLLSHVSDLELTSRKERLTPFLMIMLCYLAAIYLLVYRIELAPTFNIMLVSVTLLIALLLVITLKFKISIHGAAAWSAVGYLLGIIIRYEIHDLTWLVMLMFALAGLVSTSRLYLGYHRPVEVWSGALLGFSFAFVVMTWF